MKLSVSFISGVVFSALGLAHLARLLYGLDAQINGFILPMWVSVAGMLVAGILAAANFVHCHRCK